MRNEEVYSLLRYVLTGNPVGPPVGEIINVLGKRITTRRITTALDRHLD